MFRVDVFLAAAAVASAVLLVAPSTRGQCGARRSSCSGCHDGIAAPYSRAETWHDEHAFADVCAVCHGGDPEASSITAAHGSLVGPLDAPEATCGSCHGSAARTLADRYGAMRTPRSHDAGRDEASSAPSGPGPAARPSHDGERGPNVAMAAVVGVVGLTGAIFVAVRERAWRTSAPRRGVLGRGLAS